MDTLGELLDDLRARGVLDSSDSFGIDVERAESKAAQFQLADPGHYVLKVLQAAATAEAVFVWLRADEVEVFARGNVSGEDVERLANGRPQSEDVMMGMRAGSGLKPRELYWDLWSGTHGARLTLKKDGGLALTRQDMRRTDSGSSFHLRKTRGWFDPPPSMVAEHNAVSTRARYFPVPLKLDGRYINCAEQRAAWKPVSVAGQQVHPDACLARRVLVTRGPGGMLGPCPPNRTWLYQVEGRLHECVGLARDALLFQRPSVFLTQFSRIEHEQPWFPLEPRRLALGGTGVAVERGVALDVPFCEEVPELLRCHVDIRLPMSLEGRGEVTFVKHGISLAPVRAELGLLGVRAVVNLPVMTDLSQFAAVENVAVQNVVLYLQAHVRSMLYELGIQLPRLRLEHPELFRHYQERLKSVVWR